MELVRLDLSDGTWDAFEQNWREICEGLGEDFDEYAMSSYTTLKDECDDENTDKDSGVFALKAKDNIFHAACFLNCTQLKGYTGKVLRVRHLILSPYYDFSDLSEGEYSDIFSQCFHGVMKASNNELEAKHIKIHYRSPYDRTFFSAFALALKSSQSIANIESKGMWLYLTKA